MLPSSPRSSSTAGRRSSVMARTSSTAVATPVAADWSRPLATGSVTRSRAVSTCRRTPASAAPTPSCRSRRSRRRSSSRAVTIAARLCWSRSESRSAATAGATWSHTMASSSASRVGSLVSPGRAVTRSVPTTSPRCRIGRLVTGPVGVPTAARGAPSIRRRERWLPSRAAATRPPPCRPAPGPRRGRDPRAARWRWPPGPARDRRGRRRTSGRRPGSTGHRAGGAATRTTAAAVVAPTVGPPGSTAEASRNRLT